MEQDKTGKFIAACRKEMGYSQKQLAERLGVTEQAVSRWERGVGYPDITLLIPLSRELSVSVLEVMEGCRMKKEVSKQEVEHSIEYYMASSMDSRRPLGHAMVGLVSWLVAFLAIGIVIVFSVAGGNHEGIEVAEVSGYYFSVGGLISIFWAEKVKRMAAEYGVIAEREYEYHEPDDMEGKQVPFVMLPHALDGYRRSLPTIMPLKRTDGMEMKLGELLIGTFKAVAIMLAFYFWIQMNGAVYHWNIPRIVCSMATTSPLILAGSGLAIHGIYQVVQGRDTHENTGSAKIKVAIGSVLAVLPPMALWMLMMTT